MTQWLLAQEAALRLGCFLGVLVVVATWEQLLPRRARLTTRRARWPHNIAVAALGTALVRLALPATAVTFALGWQALGRGMLPALGLPFPLDVVLAVILLDLAIYGQHVLFHAVPVLWRLHRMHHADVDFDVTTGVRFHPLEILLSMLIKFAVIAAIGAPALAVLVFEVMLNATSMFNHGNVRLPEGVDRWLRWIVVTPDMHRVHHSVIRRETDSNYGFNLPWWDRLFGTYRAQPQEGHVGMTIGLMQFRDSAELRLDRLLTQPFRSPKAARAASR